MRNTVFMVNQAFCEDTFVGDFPQQLKKGMDELLIVKLWKKGATTEVIPRHPPVTACPGEVQEADRIHRALPLPPPLQGTGGRLTN